MGRFFTKNKTLLFTLSLAVLFFVVPRGANAGIGEELVQGGMGLLLEIFLLPLASAGLALGGMLLDTAIGFSLNTAYVFSLSPAINLGWVIIRDICNIFFIFVLIYISLGTIVQGTRFGTKQLLTQVIIAALVINFSLFITKAVVDVSNVFGLWLYGGITNTLQANSANAAKTASLSDLISTRLGVISFLRAGSDVVANSSATEVSKEISDPSKSFIARILRLVIILIATYIFFYCSILFIARSVTLLFIMVFSPLGFMGGVLPQLKEYADDWRKELTSAAMFPIAFLLMLYIALQFINSLKFLNLQQLNDQTSLPVIGGVNISTYFQYFLIILLLQACLSVAKDNSGKMGKAVGGLADSLGKFAVNGVLAVASSGTSLAARAGIAAAFAKGKEGQPTTLADRRAAARTVLAPSPQFVNSFLNARKAGGGFGAGLKAAGGDILNSTKKAAESGTWNVKNAKIPGTNNNLGNAIESLTGIKINDAQSAKDLKTEKGEWSEERKIEIANQKILAQIRDIEKAKADYAALKTPTPADRAVLDGKIKVAKGEMSDASANLSNKQLEKVNKAALKDENFIQSISQSQAEHLAEKTEASDDDKAKIWKARLSDVDSALVTPGGDIKKAIKSHSDKELENLPAATLKKAAFVKAGTMDYEKFNSLMKSSKISNSTKAEMKKNRYEAFYAAVKAKDYAKVQAELKELEAPEIAKMDWIRDESTPTEFDVLRDPEVIYSLDTKTLGKMYEELNTSQLATIRGYIEDVVTKTPKNPGSDKYNYEVAPDIVDDKMRIRLKKTAEWLDTNNIGKEF